MLGTRTLRFACWQLALRVTLLIGGAPLPLKTPKLRRFLKRGYVRNFVYFHKEIFPRHYDKSQCKRVLPEP